MFEIRVALGFKEHPDNMAMAFTRRRHEGCPSILEEEKGHGEREIKAEGHPQRRRAEDGSRDSER